MEEGFFDHFFYWTFVIASLLTAIDWWIGPDGRAKARERIGLWWLHVSESTFTGLANEDARRVERWLHGIFGRRWLGLRAFLLCSAISIAVTATLLLGNWITIYVQAAPTPEQRSLVLAVVKMTLGYDVVPDDIALNPDEAAGLDADEQRHYKELLLDEARVLERDLGDVLPFVVTQVLLPLALLNALFDWISLGVTLLLLGWMARAVTSPRLFGLVLLDLALATLLAAAVGLAVAVFAMGLAEFANTWLTDFQQQMRFMDSTVVRLRATYSAMGIWDGLLVIPALVLFTSALPSLVHLVVALVFLTSKLFRPVLQPIIGRLLYLFHVSRQGVLTQLAIGGGVAAKAVQESVKYFGA